MTEQVLLDKKQVRALLHVGYNRFIILKKAKSFPKPVSMYKGQRKLLWRYEDIKNYIDSLAVI
ncbi:helix-turn-helix transcriptional regulator [Succinivibrio dextrinosolvens]|uniref:Transcriptional regulator, AlpA family n=1 Tax=Succinivibrio dextrinosolvens TaxID=83771 RepID=A0A662Z611_9GAMM|nr:hypothetical protein [Succinivibrio dextrinosolvens]SFJ75280.1 hypothetical protein SAMN04487865_1001164 [Succinivibrio dextrinosolvens]